METPQNQTVPSHTTAPAAKEPENGMAVASLVLGIVSFTGPWILTGIPAIILGALALKKPGGRGFSIAGIILGSITVVLTVIGVILLFFLLAMAAGSSVNTDSSPYEPESNPGSSSTSQSI